MLDNDLHDVALHPLFARYRETTTIYDILEHLLHLDSCNSTSWHGMCVTEPPLRYISVYVTYLWCDKLNDRVANYCYLCVENVLDNPTGVTIKKVFDAIWATDLSRNLGLIEDDMSCEGKAFRGSYEQQCICYDLYRVHERTQAQLDFAARELQEAEEKYKDAKMKHQIIRDMQCDFNGPLEKLLGGSQRGLEGLTPVRALLCAG
jgi:hypothetical protein